MDELTYCELGILTTCSVSCTRGQN